MEKQAKEETVVENATPDYAAGLVSTQVKPNKIKTHKSQTRRKKKIKRGNHGSCYSETLKHWNGILLSW